MSRFSSWMLAIGLLLVVLLPVIAGNLNEEMARWHLAAAVNAVKLEKGDYQASLDSARSYVDPLEQLKDYWLFRTELAFAEQELDELPGLVEAAMKQDRRFATIAGYMRGRLELNGKFSIVVDVMEAAIPEKERDDPTILNFLAYMRALAGVELDRALQDVDGALEHFPNDSAIRDTRAWILFQMGRPLEALEDAEFAVERLEEQKRKLDPLGLGEMLTSLQESQVDDGEDESAPLLTVETANPAIWNEGVIRYHRARILESLGRDDDAKVDFEWLKKQRLPADEQLR